MALASVVTFVVRALLVALFLPFSALDKIIDFRGAVEQARQRFPERGLATALILTGLGVEIFMSLGILTGTADRFSAFILAGYCGVTALLWKPFWAQGDFFASGASKGRDLFWDFLKNFALAGGFLVITFGVTAASVPAFFFHPFSSTHPYASAPP